jgi:hypothetical protein
VEFLSELVIIYQDGDLEMPEHGRTWEKRTDILENNQPENSKRKKQARLDRPSTGKNIITYAT